MASKSAQQEPEKAEVIEELLDALDTALDRVKVLYEQFFLGIQKQPPSHLHTDVERKLRDLAQLQIRNTALRYRFATLQQKFGSYNSYWRRTLRQIENGTYARNLSKVGRQAARTGAAVPEEILAAMPKRMREQVIRDREAALALARLRERPAEDEELLTLADEAVDVDVGDLELDEDHAFISEPSDVRRNALTASGALRVDEADADFDVDAFFASVIREDTDPEIKPPPPDAEAAPPARRSGSRPPALSRTRTGHPAPAALSGQPDAAVPPGNRLSSPGLPAAEPAAASSIPVSAQAASPASAGAQPRSAMSPGPAAGSAARSPDAAAASTASGSQRAARPAPEVDGASRPVGEPRPAAAGSRAADTAMGRRVGIPVIPQPAASSSAKPAGPPPALAPPDAAARLAPSQATRPLRIAPGAAAARAPAAVETLAGPFPRIPSPPPSLTAARGAATGAVPEPIVDPPSSPNLVPTEAAASSRRTTPAAGVPVRPAEAVASSPRATPPVGEPSRPAEAARVSSRPATPAAGVPVRPAEAVASSPRTTPAAGVPVRPAEAARASSRPATPAAGVPARPAEAVASSPRATPPGEPSRPAGAPPSSRRTPPPERAASGDRPRPRTPTPRPEPEPRPPPPPGMSDADVNALYAKYVKAKQILGEEAEPGTYGKLLKTIHAQAPKIMEQYKSKGVDFSIVVKDNQVIIRAKPKP